jgi:hypothetical protein
MWDRSLVIVTADHGISFRPGDRRRGVTPTNLQDIAFPPLFVKLPGQKHGRISDHHVQTIDILPTIADVLGVHIPWHVDGHSALGHYETDRVTVGTVSGKDRVLLRRRAALLRRKIALFGDGRGGPGVFGYGPDAGLIGRPVAALPLDPAASDQASIVADQTRQLLERLPRASPLVPSLIEAHVSGAGAADGRAVALAVNGRIAATTKIYSVFGSAYLAALVPPSAFHPGRNEVAAYWIGGSQASPRLQPIGSPLTS